MPAILFPQSSIGNRQSSINRAHPAPPRPVGTGRARHALHRPPAANGHRALARRPLPRLRRRAGLLVLRSLGVGGWPTRTAEPPRRGRFVSHPRLDLTSAPVPGRPGHALDGPARFALVLAFPWAFGQCPHHETAASGRSQRVRSRAARKAISDPCICSGPRSSSVPEGRLRG